MKKVRPKYIIAAVLILSVFFAACTGRVRVAKEDAGKPWSEYGGGQLHNNMSYDKIDGDIILLFKLKPKSMISSSMVVLDNNVICTSRKGFIEVFELSEGDKIDEMKIKEPMFGAPAYDDSVLYYSTIKGNRTFRAYNIHKGKYLWRKDLGYIESAASVYNEYVFAANIKGDIYCLDKKSGEIKWEFDAGSSVYSGMLVLGDKVFAGSIKGKIYALDINSGSEIWSFDTGDILRGSPASDGRMIFWGTVGNRLLSLDPASGNINWEFKTAGAVYSSPTVAGGRVIFGCNDENVYSLDAATGEEQWKFAVGSVVNTSCLAVGSKIYFGSLNKIVYSLESATGDLLWEYPVEGRVSSNPAYFNGKLIFPVENRFLYVFGKPES
ncbi:PQQ-binding-like beta-propeller repeat protein [candidate division KSB1 bacterium]